MMSQNYCYKYPRPAVTMDCIVFGYDENRELSVLLVKRSEKGDAFPGWWAFPGGFLKMDEDADSGALRELKEETSLEIEHMEQLGCFTDVNRDPRGRVITIAYFALVHKQEVIGGDDAKEAAWFPVSEVPPLAFDHDKILQVALKRLNF